MKTTLRTSLFTLIAAVAFGMTPPAFADQPHMDEAISHLEAAKAQLQEAWHDKDGFRIDAIHAIDNAIRLVHEGKHAGHGNEKH